MKDKEQNDDINNKDFDGRKICGNFEKIEQLYEETLFWNVYNDKRYYDDFNEEKIDKNDTEETKQLSNEEYLLKNDDDNDEKCYSV